MNRSRWLVTAIAGCAMVAIALFVALLVIVDKTNFGWLVGRYFLQTLTGGLFVGAVIMLAGAWNLHERRNWRGRTLIAWALVALTSPAFGLMFVLPWLLLALSLPVVIGVFITLWRERGETAPIG